MFDLAEDMTLKIGKDAGELNMIILIPKTEKRANVNDVSLNKLLHSRTSNAAVLESLSLSYRGKNSVNLKKVKLKVEVFDLDTGILLGSDITKAISDTASKAHGAMDLHDVTPLRSCATGGRKVVMLAEFGLAKDVEPKFQLYDSHGIRLLEEEETLLRQPQMTDTSIMRESIVFITPPQPQAEYIRSRGYKVRLVARRSSDGYVSKKKFDFDYIPHDYYDPCFFCYENPDNIPQSGSRAKLVPMKEVARPGLRKRQMSEVDPADYLEKKTFKLDAHRKHQNMNRVPVIKTTQSSAHPRLPVKILPAPAPASASAPTPPAPSPITLIPVSRLQCIKKIDPSNNIEKTFIKTEPVEETESPTPSAIPFHDIANQTAIIRTFPFTVTTTSSSLIFPTITEIKKEL